MQTDLVNANGHTELDREAFVMMQKTAKARARIGFFPVGVPLKGSVAAASRYAHALSRHTHTSSATQGCSTEVWYADTIENRRVCVEA